MDVGSRFASLESKMDTKLDLVEADLKKIEAQNTAIMHALQKKKKGIIFVSF